MSRTAFWFCSTMLLAIVLAFPRYKRPGTEATLAWDVSGYYLYLPAIFIHHDLERLAFLPKVIEKYQPSHSPDQAFHIANGNSVMKYPAGMAVLYLPFFAVGHAVAKLTSHPADGFSLPYQAAIHLGSVLAACLGLWFLRKTLLRYFPDRTVGWALLLLAFGTNFLNYATFDAANAHGWLFLLLALLTHLSIRYHERPTLRRAAGIGACAGLAALVRPTEAIYALVPLLWGVGSVAALRQRLSFFAKNWAHLLAATVAMAAIGSVQLAYWKHVSGHWLVYSYGEQGFSFLHPHFLDVFFSYRKGWLVYTPLMAFALAGYYFLWKRQTPPFSILLFFLLNTWLVCAWDIWWYGGSFGQRAFVQGYALLAFPLCGFLSWQSEIRKPKAAIPKLLLAACVALNLFQTYQAHWGPWEAEAMNRAYYWRIFAKTKNDPWDRLLLDTREGFFGKKRGIRPVHSADFEAVADTLGLSRKHARSGAWAAAAGPDAEYSRTLLLPRPAGLEVGQWLHIGGWFYAEQLEYDTWRMPQLVVSFEKEGKSVRDRVLRPFRVMQPGQWQAVGMNVRVPRTGFDTIKIFVWNAGSRAGVWLDDLWVEAFEEE